jgi:hypothetical protein
VRDAVNYEGQAAIELEQQSAVSERSAYQVSLGGKEACVVAIGTENRSDKDLKNCATELVSKRQYHSKEDSKMGALPGFMMGYYLGTKAGPERYEELRKAWQTIVNSEELQDLIATGTSVLSSACRKGRQYAFPAAQGSDSRNGEVAGAWKR